MNHVGSLIVVMTVVALCCGCNGDEEPSQTDDVGVEDAGEDANDVDDNLLEEWPGQQIDDDPLGLDWDMPEADDGLDVLVANVGNVDVLRCNNVDFNMCWVEQEEIVADQIAWRSPDLILLQEVLVPEQCDELDEGDVDDDHVCHRDHDFDEPAQVRRLVGDDYTIACDDQNGYECVAAKVGVASIEDCDDGELCWDLARAGDEIDGCDPGFTVSAVTVDYDGTLFDVVNVHPPSDAPGVDDPQQCRHDYFDKFFGDDAPLIEQELVFVGGDFNFDPYRDSESNPEVELWRQHVSTSFEQTSDDPDQFAYHSGIVEHDPPYWTILLMSRTWDHAISNGLKGRCVTLGAHPGEPAIDLFHGNEGERLDHLALQCRLAIAW